jgi:acetylornithine deacetylase
MNHPSLKILEELIAIESVNPALEANASGEKNITSYLEARCKNSDLKTTRQSVLEGRDNLLIELRAPSEKPRPTLLFEAHTDTVGLGSMPDPLQPIYRDGKLFGRGSCDNKACLAAMLWALEEAAAQKMELPCDVVLAATADEEHRFRGVLRLLEAGLNFSGAVVGEATQMQIIIAHKGVCRFAVETRGRAAHSSLPHEGDSAISQMRKVLDFIADEIEPELSKQNHPLCGAPTIVVGTIHGGTQINIVPERCEIQVDRRVVPGENSRAVLADFENRLRNFTKSSGVRFSIHELLLDNPLDTSRDEAVVAAAQKVAAQLGFSTGLFGVPYGSDASKLQSLGDIPTIVFGPGSIAQAHTAEEFVPVEEVGQAAEFYLRLMQNFAA